MRILITNDDGITRPASTAGKGRQVFRRCLCRRARDRPVRRRAFASRLATRCGCAKSRPVISRCRARRPIASSWRSRLLADKQPDLVLSGVNRGQNVAEDVTYSGTIAAAMEGTLLGVQVDRAVQSYGASRRASARAGTRRSFAPQVIQKIFEHRHSRGHAAQCQFPSCAAAKSRASPSLRRAGATRELMRIEERRDGRAIPYYWLMFQRAGFTPGAGHRSRGARRATGSP